MKSINVKVTGRWVSVEYIVTVSVARIKRFDNRPAWFKVAAKEIAKRDFCKAHDIDRNKVCANYRFEVTE